MFIVLLFTGTTLSFFPFPLILINRKSKLMSSIFKLTNSPTLMPVA